MRGLAVIGRDLEGEGATFGQLRQKVVEEGAVVIDPVEAGVRDHQVHRLGRPPAVDLGHLELESARNLSWSGQFDHFLRVVDANDVCRRPPFEQVYGELTGATGDFGISDEEPNEAAPEEEGDRVLR